MSGHRDRPQRYHTYTKKMMDRIIDVALIDMQFPFLLSLLGRDQIAETMGGLIVTEIIGIFLVYCMKSFFETNAAEKIRMQEKSLDNEAEQSGGVAPVQPEYNFEMEENE